VVFYKATSLIFLFVLSISAPYVVAGSASLLAFRAIITPNPLGCDIYFYVKFSSSEADLASVKPLFIKVFTVAPFRQFEILEIRYVTP